ncbi:hypothetical protein E2C01_099525 [Portunus trituberculatus]|uniref:Uncharacterized protein n=1 Tax=Portunus trituberculatus TaxID=210409 RepID=A0A5B7KFL6_PORTR|nr:hypothetical protein [Portunus trituberculatus]
MAGHQRMVDTPLRAPVSSASNSSLI